MAASFFVTLTMLGLPTSSYSQPNAGHEQPSRPYGGYCRGPHWGWYGAHRQVSTIKEARLLLERYFTDKPVEIGAITERDLYFEAEIKDKDHAVTDRLIIDKRTGRIRSVY